ncbi:MAG: hypothetical protein V4671_07125 [Armatimonadota bacterium]
MKRRSAVPLFPVLNTLVILCFSVNCAVAQDQPPPPDTPAPVTTEPLQVDVPEPVDISYPSRLLSGFGDIVYSSAGSGTNRNFSLGQLTLQYTSALSPRVFVFTELTFSPRPDAGAGTPAAPGFNAEVERLFARYDQSDILKVSAGRYHTPINWWNTAFHHGLWLQTTIARPEMTRFGGQFIPPHFTGALIEGTFPASGLNLSYNVGIGNGRGAVFSRSGDAGDSNGAAAKLLKLYVRPDKLYGLEVGGSVYDDRVSVTTTTPAGGGPATTSTRSVNETIVAGHIVYQKENPEVIAEYARSRHREDNGTTTSSDAYYIQVAYRRPGSLFKPYYRYERMTVAETDPILTLTPSLTGNTVGVRYDFTELAAFKLEYRNMERGPKSRSFGVNTAGLFAQVSFAF